MSDLKIDGTVKRLMSGIVCPICRRRGFRSVSAVIGHAFRLLNFVYFGLLNFVYFFSAARSEAVSLCVTNQHSIRN